MLQFMVSQSVGHDLATEQQQRPFLCSSSVYSSHLFLISCASVRSIQLLSFIVPVFAWNIPLISPVFLKRSLVCPTLLFPLFLCTVHLRRLSYLSSGTLHSVGYICPFLCCLLLLFFSQLVVRPVQTTTLPSCVSFSLGWFWSPPPIQLWTSIHSSSHSLSIRYNPLNVFVTSTV